MDCTYFMLLWIILIAGIALIITVLQIVRVPNLKVMIHNHFSFSDFCRAKCEHFSFHLLLCCLLLMII
ncbi:hypothetical protein RchiOBHm_Chr1g0355651 [Rosa chinensis]|uniref:Uncharacterized protein n=1 Tax=Rosa chinensis TaxID=74649 RepID=A0A2P6SHF4_ROSCH|nr:hypothetical protein RchiOBHm_Chr1g0355651 [Rosa chinensis]